MLGGGALLLLYPVITRASALGHLIVRPGNILSMGFVDGTPTITLTIVAQNTSSSELLVNSIAGNVFSNETYIGNVSRFEQIVIPANGTASIQVDVRLQLVGVVTDLIRAFTYKNFTQNIEIDGYANVSSVQVPLALKFSVGG